MKCPKFRLKCENYGFKLGDSIILCVHYLKQKYTLEREWKKRGPELWQGVRKCTICLDCEICGRELNWEGSYQRWSGNQAWTSLCLDI